MAWVIMKWFGCDGLVTERSVRMRGREEISWWLVGLVLFGTAVAEKRLTRWLSCAMVSRPETRM